MIPDVNIIGMALVNEKLPDLHVVFHLTLLIIINLETPIRLCCDSI